MRILRHFTLLTAVTSLLAAITLACLSSCGGGGTPAVREAANIVPIVVLTVLGGGEDGTDLGGLVDGSPADGGLVVTYPCDLHAQVFLPDGSESYEGAPLVGDAVTTAGKVHFETSDDGGATWVAFRTDVNLLNDGTATHHNFNGVEGCPSIMLLRARFVPSTVGGGPKKNNGTPLDEGSSDTYQQFTLSTIDSPFVNAYIVVNQGRGTDNEEQFPLNIGPGAPTLVPGTRADTGEDGTPDTFPVSFTLHFELVGVHTYTLYGKSHISGPDSEIDEDTIGSFDNGDDFAIEMTVNSCDTSQHFSHTFTGISPIGNGPLLSHLYIGGSTWEIGDPHAQKTEPAAPPAP